MFEYWLGISKRAALKTLEVYGVNWMTVLLTILPACVGLVLRIGVAGFAATKSELFETALYTVLPSAIIAVVVFIAHFVRAPVEMHRELLARISNTRTDALKSNSQLATELQQLIGEAQSLISHYDTLHTGNAEAWVKNCESWCARSEEVMKDRVDEGEIVMFRTIAPSTFDFPKQALPAVHAKLNKMRRILGRVLERTSQLAQ